MMLASLLRSASRGRAPQILMYHAVADVAADPNEVCVSPQRFAEQLDYLRRRGLRGVSVRELLAAPPEERDNRLVALTFDDGYRNFVTHAAPALRQVGFSATLFAISGLLGRDNAWDSGGPQLPLVTADDLRALDRSGIEIGSHTRTHPQLTELDDERLGEEVNSSREALADVLGHDVEGFCYPYGAHDDRVVDAVRAAGYGYACAYKTHERYERHTLPRMHVGQRDGPLRLEAKLRVYDRVQRARSGPPSPGGLWSPPAVGDRCE